MLKNLIGKEETWKKKENTICCQSVVRNKCVVIKIGCHMHN